MRGRGLGRSKGTSGSGNADAEGTRWSLRKSEHCVCVEVCVRGSGCELVATLFASEELTVDWLEEMMTSAAFGGLEVQEGRGGRGGLADLLSENRNHSF